LYRYTTRTALAILQTLVGTPHRFLSYTHSNLNSTPVSGSLAYNGYGWHIQLINV